MASEQPLSGATDWQDWRFEFGPDGTLHARGSRGFREPVCPECRTPILWALDMFSFSTGDDHVLMHARCAWKPEAFDREKARTRPDTEGERGG